MIDADEMRCLTTPSPAAALDRYDGAATADPATSRSDEIHRELDRVVDSVRFDASERNRRFLAYVVEEALAGRGGRIKAYNIATEVFGRDVNFDPQLDPVVRMEARRLRRSLERFYLTCGDNSSIRIAMPKGGYVPEFQTAALWSPSAGDAQANAPSEPAGTERASTILVAPFDAEGDQSMFLHFNRGFAEQVTIGLARFPEIAVFERPSDAHYASAAAGEQRRNANGEFVLSGSTALFAGSLNVKAVLVQARTGRVLWGQSFERDLQCGNVLSIRDEVANSLVRALAQPYGVISSIANAAAQAKEPRSLSPVECVIRFYEYKRTYRRDLFSGARQCLERTAITNPDYAEAFACLSQLYTDGHRFGFAPTESPSGLRRQAIELADRAVQLAPDSSRGHHARGLAYWFAQDVPASLKAMQMALAFNPNATDIMTDLGLIWSLLGEWGKGVPLLEKASAQQLSRLGANCVGLSLYHFVNGRYEEALAEARDVDMPDVTHGFVARAISLVRLGRKEEAARAVQRIVELAPCRGGGILADLAGVNANPDLADKVLAALREAGLSTEVTRH